MQFAVKQATCLHLQCTPQAILRTSFSSLFDLKVIVGPDTPQVQLPFCACCFEHHLAGIEYSRPDLLLAGLRTAAQLLVLPFPSVLSALSAQSCALHAIQYSWQARHAASDLNMCMLWP